MTQASPPAKDPFAEMKAKVAEKVQSRAATAPPPPRRMPAPSNPVEPSAVPNVIKLPSTPPATDQATPVPAPSFHPSKPTPRPSVEEAQIILVNREDLVGSPHAQPRDHSNVRTDLQDLASSIKTHGLLDPIKVYWDDVAGKYRVVDGHRRLAAIDQLGLTDPSVLEHVRAVPIGGDQLKAVQMLAGDDRWLVLAMALNAQRKDLTGAERGRVYLRLKEKLGTVVAVAEVCGVSRVTVHKAIGYAGNVAAHVDHARGVEKPDWAHKAWFNSMHGLLRTSTRLDDLQRRAVVQWLRSVAKAAERGEVRVPGFGHQEASED